MLTPDIQVDENINQQLSIKKDIRLYLHACRSYPAIFVFHFDQTRLYIFIRPTSYKLKQLFQIYHLYIITNINILIQVLPLQSQSNIFQNHRQQQAMSVDWSQSRMHALNNSTSKPTYAFPKSPRFSGSLRPLCDTFYNVTRNIQTGKGASIGKGNKTSFGDRYGFPSPLQYEIRSSFEGNYKTNKGVKLGLGRQNIKYGGIFSKSETPDPTHYNIKDPRINSPKSGYTIRPKLKEQQFTNQKNPGPGQYNSISTISATGIYNLSNLTNCACPRIKPSKPYDSRAKEKTPGPGQYNNQKQAMNQTGKYFISKYSDTRCRSFSKSHQKDQLFENKAKLPGPGAYNYYSQFGARTKML